jgi:hypothetical protein
MNQILIILFLSVANIVFYYVTYHISSSISHKLSHNLVNIALIIAYTIATYYILQSAYYDESFFFEVSPARKQCLEESVLPIFNRTSGCCGKGTIGGIPARYTYPDLIDPNNKLNWNRVDAFGAEDSITPPTQTCNDPSIGY